MIFFKKKENKEYFLLVGLGNPGKKYEDTRHNIGFAALDYIAKEENVSVVKMKHDALCGETIITGKKVLFVKPQTYMNLSGVSVKKAMDYYKIPAENIIILHDDIALPEGIIRIKKEGTAGGHNGISSIINGVGNVFPRIKIGAGEKPNKEMDTADWVLSRLSSQEKEKIESRFEDIYGAVREIVKGDIAQAMNLYNATPKEEKCSTET